MGITIAFKHFDIHQDATGDWVADSPNFTIRCATLPRLMDELVRLGRRSA